MDDFIVATLRYGTPLVYVTLAGVLAQRAGVWNLGLEGLMIVGCCAHDWCPLSHRHCSGCCAESLSTR